MFRNLIGKGPVYITGSLKPITPDPLKWKCVVSFCCFTLLKFTMTVHHGDIQLEQINCQARAKLVSLRTTALSVMWYSETSE